jgi:hypothetical protein
MSFQLSPRRGGAFADIKMVDGDFIATVADSSTGFRALTYLTPCYHSMVTAGNTTGVCTACARVRRVDAGGGSRLRNSAAELRAHRQRLPAPCQRHGRGPRPALRLGQHLDGSGLAEMAAGTGRKQRDRVYSLGRLGAAPANVRPR